MAPDDMTKVVIAEKPSVAMTLRKYWAPRKIMKLTGRKRPTITWAVGHLLELKTPEQYDDELKNWWKSFDIPFIPSEFEVQPVKGRGKARNNFKP